MTDTPCIHDMQRNMLRIHVRLNRYFTEEKKIIESPQSHRHTPIQHGVSFETMNL